MVGKVLRIDYNTKSASRGKFARLAVEVNLEKPLVSQLLVDGRKLRIEYENLPQICFQCGILWTYIFHMCPHSIDKTCFYL